MDPCLTFRWWRRNLKKLNAHSKRENRLPLKYIKVSHHKLFRKFTNIQNETEIAKRIHLESIWLQISLPEEVSGFWEDATFSHKLRESYGFPCRWRHFGPVSESWLRQQSEGLPLGESWMKAWLNEATSVQWTFTICYVHNYNFQLISHLILTIQIQSSLYHTKISDTHRKV